jgi:hypothetical protein
MNVAQAVNNVIGFTRREIFTKAEAGQAFAMAAVYAARSQSVKLYRANHQWVVEYATNAKGTKA